MNVGPRARALIQSYEQCRLTAYLPTPNDVPTIGWGSTGPDIELGMTWTQEQCDARFATDLARFATGVENALDGAPTLAREFGAIVSLAYNIGTGAFASSTLCRLHRAGNKAGAAAQFARWNKQAGRVLAGLTRRRAAEAALYLGSAA